MRSGRARSGGQACSRWQSPQAIYGGQWDGRSPVPVKQKYIVLAHAVPQSSRMVSVAARGRVPTFTMMSSIANSRVLIAPEGIDARGGEKERLRCCR